MHPRRYTLIYHNYIGYGSYVINIRQVAATQKGLERYKHDDSLHFVIAGWPKITYPDGKMVKE